MHNKIIIALFFFFVAASCSKSNSYEAIDNNNVIKETLKSFLENITTAYKLDSAIFIHVEYSDFIKKNSIDTLLNSNIISNKNQLSVIKLLSQHISDSSKIKLDQFKIDAQNIIVEDNSENKHLFNSLNYFATIVLSNAVVDEKLNLGAYYIGVNCGKGCSSGFIVVASTKSKKWQIEDVILLWESK